MSAPPADVQLGALVLPAPPGSAPGWIPLLNTACPWADELEQNYRSPHTAGATTRTACLHGPRPLESVYDQDESVHQVALSPTWSLNSFGYSPTPLRTYLARVKALLSPALDRYAAGGPRPKPIIVSLTGQPAAVAEGVKAVCHLAGQLEPHGGAGRSSLLAVEVNLSCPNIRGTDVPSGFSPSFLAATLAAISALYIARPTADAAWRHVTVGLKVPPYTYPAQFSALLRALEDAAPSSPGPHVVGFVTATNTLGGCMWTTPEGAALPVDPSRGFTGDGGMGGESLHPLALGCVARLRRMLDASAHASVRAIALLAAGGCSSGAAARRFVAVGARACGVATALGREGPDVFARLRREIEAAVECRL